jgi:hypothetical protein
MTHDIEPNGTFEGYIKREFHFNRLEFEHDSFNGICASLKYVLKVEMCYQAAIMKSTMTEELPLVIKNFTVENTQG